MQKKIILTKETFWNYNKIVLNLPKPTRIHKMLRFWLSDEY